MKKLLLGAAALVLATGACTAAPERGSKAPSFTGRDLSGRAVSLSALKGKQNVLLVFWSTDCLISASEANALQKQLAGFQGKPLTTLGVVTNKVSAKLASVWAKEHKLTLRSLLDTDHKMLKSYGVKVTPTFVLIDKQGAVRASYVGGGQSSRQALIGDINQLLGQGDLSAPENPTRTNYG